MLGVVSSVQRVRRHFLSTTMAWKLPGIVLEEVVQTGRFSRAMLHENAAFGRASMLPFLSTCLSLSRLFLQRCGVCRYVLGGGNGALDVV